MNGHNITNESLALSMVLVLIAILVSYREKLALEKDIIWSICRAIVQLIIVGYVLKYIFNVNHAVLTLLMVLFICFNAAWNAKKRSKYIDKAFVSSFIAITTGAGLTLAVLVFSGRRSATTRCQKRVLNSAGKTRSTSRSTRSPRGPITMKPCRRSPAKSPTSAPCAGRNSVR